MGGVVLKTSSKKKDISLKKNAHLGDVATVMVLLNTICLRRSREIWVSGPPVIKEFMNLFDFHGLNYADTNDDEPETSIANLMGLGDAETFFLTEPMFKDWTGCAKEPTGHEVELPSPRFNKVKEKNQVAAFQFDTRSFHRKKPKMSRSEMKCVLKKFAKGYETVGVGGQETEEYLDVRFFRGDLKDIVEKLESSRIFVGSDSGISHLAGMMGMDGDVIITHYEEKSFRKLSEFYARMYPSLRTHPRSASKAIF